MTNMVLDSDFIGQAKRSCPDVTDGSTCRQVGHHEWQHEPEPLTTHFRIRVGDEWFKVRGFVNVKGWLEWSDADGCQGVSRPSHRGIEWEEDEDW